MHSSQPATWALCAPALLYISRCVILTVCLSLWANLCRTPSPHTSHHEEHICPPLASVMVLSTAFAVTLGAQQWNKSGLFRTEGGFPGTYLPPLQYICPKADLLIAALSSNKAPAELVRSAVCVSCCLCGCKLSYLFKVGRRREAICEARLDVFHVFLKNGSSTSFAVYRLQTKVLQQITHVNMYSCSRCLSLCVMFRCCTTTEEHSVHPLHGISITLPLLCVCRALGPDSFIH